MNKPQAVRHPDRPDWRGVRAFIDRHQSFLVTSHIFPDGDAVGSQLALAAALRTLGKKVLVVDEHPVPKIYEFLDRRRTAKVYDRKLDARIAKCDAAFVVDVSSLERVGELGGAIARAGLATACIDHHRTNAGEFGVNVIVPTAASTGELIYDLVLDLGVSVAPAIARAVFVAESTDTGWFRFPNTTPHAHRLAADLVERGVKPGQMYAAIHETVRWQRMNLMKLVLGTLHSACDGRIAYFYMTHDMLRESGATQEDAEDFTDIPRVLHSVKLILFFRETRGKIKISLRSKDGPSVVGIAKKHGGGGHAKAAGILMDGTLDAAIKTILADAKALLRRHA